MIRQIADSDVCVADTVTAQDIMRADPPRLRLRDKIRDAMDIVVKHKTNLVPVVVEEDRYFGGGMRWGVPCALGSLLLATGYVLMLAHWAQNG